MRIKGREVEIFFSFFPFFFPRESSVVGAISGRGGEGLRRTVQSRVAAGRDSRRTTIKLTARPGDRAERGQGAFVKHRARSQRSGART